MQIVAFADPTKLGPSQLALIFVTTQPGQHEDIVAEMTGWSEISYLSTTLGDSDICAQCICRDQDAMLSLRQKIARLPGVATLRILPELTVRKALLHK